MARLDEIVEFTELGSFLELPVRTYSLGMQARLAFAMATCIDPEILLLDEGIGAGDAAFLDKANERLNSFISRTGILVFGLAFVGACEQVLQQGGADGTRARVVDRYGRACAQRYRAQ